MVLSDEEIKARIEQDSITIEPFVEDNVEAASVDLRLGNEFVEYYSSEGDDEIIDAREQAETEYGQHIESDQIVVYPDNFILATTMETIGLPDDVAANVVGRSSLGRLGVEIHKTAGYIDPGFEGEITLEIVNDNPRPVRLYADDRIAQIVFHEMTVRATEPYGHDQSQYQHQSGATESGMSFE